MKKLKSISLIYLLVITVLMYLLNCFTTLSADDWHYHFIWGTTVPIRSIGDIFQSQYNHYIDVNGRTVVHFLLQLFDGILGKALFNYFNALFFGLFMYLIARLTCKDTKQHDYKIISIAFCLIFFLFPSFKHCFLWLSGSFNYLWVGTAILTFHLLLFKEGIPKWAYLPLLLFGIICGWSNEAIVIGVAAAYFIYFIFHRKEIKGHRIYMLIGLFIGTLLLVSSPGSIDRAIHKSGMASVPWLVSLYGMNNLRLFFVLLVLMLVKLFRNKKEFISWVKREQIFLYVVVVTFLFVVTTGIGVARSRFGVELFSLLLILRMIDWNKISNKAVTILNIITVIASVYAISECANCYKVNQQELSQICSDNQVIATTDPSSNRFARRYTLNYAFRSYIGNNKFKYYGELPGLSDYFGYSHVIFMPNAFLEDLKNHPGKYDEMHTENNLPFFAQRVPKGAEIQKATVAFNNDNSNSLLNRFLDRLSGNLHHYTIKTQTVSIDDQDYVIVPKLRPNLDNRLKEITLH